MAEKPPITNDFILNITEIVENHIANEQFGVSELAYKVGMSRSNLLRKVKSLTNLSVSQFIRQIRLENAMLLLKEGQSNVSEVSFKVGFSSTSYFIKCFREHFGYPPGEVGKNEIENFGKQRDNKIRMLANVIGFILIVIIVSIFLYFKFASKVSSSPDKSIAVLPFINDSNDSTNVYIINGLMESVLNNLQKIEDLRVVSRTSVEKYRAERKTIPEMAEELSVGYIVEGSGQKVGDQILLTVQLINAANDEHIWSEQFNREVSDIFALQMEVAKSIADKIEVIITPEEEEQINKIPTHNLVAYDYFLRGKECMNKGTGDGLLEAIPILEKAIEHDETFARAYAAIAICYFYLDVFSVEKKYVSELNNFAEQSLLYDKSLAQGLMAKALYYININEYNNALPYLEKALKLHPNSALIINTLADFYTSYKPNTEKYLEYALKGIQIDIASNDSSDASFIYLHLGNAFIQSGFLNEAEKYIQLSIAYNPDNLYAEYVNAYIVYAREKDLSKTRKLLEIAYQKDQTRLDILQEIAKICYYQNDIQSSYKYYEKFIEATENFSLDIYPHERARIAFVLRQIGDKKKAEEYINSFKVYADNDKSIYSNILQMEYLLYHGENKKALEQLKLFLNQNNFHYWIVLFLKDGPMMEALKSFPEFFTIIEKIEERFWKNHNRIKVKFQKDGLI